MSSTQEVGPIFGKGEGPAQALLRSPTVIILSIGLWGMNIHFFRLFKLDYVHILTLDLVKERQAISASDDSSDKSADLDHSTVSKGAYSSPVPRGSRITGGKCVMLSFFLLFLLHFSEYIWVTGYGGSSIGATFIFYISVCLAFLVPLTSTRWIRIAASLVFQRTFELFNPRCSCILQPASGPRPIPFVDVFYADAMCSLSKVFFDWGMLFHMAYYYPKAVPKSLGFILIPSCCAAIPYLIRARQCLIMYTVGRIKNDSKRYQHLLNALKYCSSIFPICLSAYQQTLTPEKAKGFEKTLLVLLIINATYALAWDIIMDWGMFQDPTAVAQYACTAATDSPVKIQSCGHAMMRPKLRFGITASAAIALADTILRFSWLLRFCVFIFPSKDHFVLATQLLEAFRRAIWNLLRVEWESIKQNKTRQLEESDDDDEVAPFFKAPPSLQMTHIGNGTTQGRD